MELYDGISSFHFFWRRFSIIERYRFVAMYCDTAYSTMVQNLKQIVPYKYTLQYVTSIRSIYTID